MTLIISASLISPMVADARQRQPQEACGLLLGVGHTVQQVIPIPNSDPHPEQGFVLAPQTLVTALYEAEQAGLQVIGIYHSHPRSASFPSERDIQGALLWPQVAQVIISLQGGKARVQAWNIQPGQVERIDITHTAGAETAHSLSDAACIAIIGAALMAMLLLVGLSISLLPVAPVITPVP